MRLGLGVNDTLMLICHSREPGTEFIAEKSYSGIFGIIDDSLTISAMAAN